MLGSMPMFTEECQWPQTAGGWENVQPISSEKQRVNRQAFRFSNTPCATLRHIVCVCEIAIPLGTPTDYPAMLAREAWWSVGHCRPTVHSAVAKAALLFHFSQCYSRSFIQPKQSSTRTLWPLASRLYACRDRPGRISRDPRNAPPFGEWLPWWAQTHTLSWLGCLTLNKKRHPTSEKPFISWFAKTVIVTEFAGAKNNAANITLRVPVHSNAQLSPLKPLQHSAHWGVFFFPQWKKKTDPKANISKPAADHTNNSDCQLEETLENNKASCLHNKRAHWWDASWPLRMPTRGGNGQRRQCCSAAGQTTAVPNARLHWWPQITHGAMNAQVVVDTNSK